MIAHFLRMQCSAELVAEHAHVPASLQAQMPLKGADTAQTVQFLTAALEAMPQGVIIFDSSGTILQANAGAVAIYRYSRQELMGQRVEVLLPEQFFQVPVCRRESYLTTSPVRPIGYSSECVLRRKDGSKFAAEVTLAGIVGETRAACAAFVTDTSPHKQQEEALRKSEEQLRLFVQYAPGAIAMFDREMRYIIPSRRWLTDYKLSDDVRGRSQYEVVPETPEHWKAAHRRGLAGETLKCDGERFARADGSVQWVKWDLVPWRATTGEIGGIVIAAEDVTAQKEAEWKIRESEERFELAVRGSSDGIWDVNLVGGQEYLSDRALELLGFQSGECTSRYEGWELRIHPDDRDRVLLRLNEHLDKRVPFDVEYRLRLKSGEYRWFRSRGRAVWNEEGKPLRMAGSITDITERVSLQQHLQEALAELAQLKNQLEAENLYLQEEIKSSYDFEEIIGESKQLQQVLYKVEQVAPTATTVLITGETGTGKELLARAIHSRSPRKEHPLVKVNCAALPASLIEIELFGHERGAFTGALSQRIGRFELANHGTIFLDEIGDLPLELQSKLLRVLQEGEFERIGSSRPIKADVRVIAATNCDLARAVRESKFRSDLFYRLNVFPIVVPALRERKTDIPLLVRHFIEKGQTRLGKKITTVPKRLMDAFIMYEWPGNVRELANIIERAMILSSGGALTLDEPLGRIQAAPEAAENGEMLDAVERAHILKVLNETGWKIKGKGNAADRLGLNPSTLRSRAQKLGISRPTKCVISHKSRPQAPG